MTRPNIVYILMDDLGYGDVSCYGAQHLHTPHIDQLSREGMRFSDAHAPSAVCTPSRYGTLTGRYCWRTELKDGVLNGFSDPLIDRDQPTIASFCKEKVIIQPVLANGIWGWDGSLTVKRLITVNRLIMVL